MRRTVSVRWEKVASRERVRVKWKGGESIRSRVVRSRWFRSGGIIMVFGEEVGETGGEGRVVEFASVVMRGGEEVPAIPDSSSKVASSPSGGSMYSNHFLDLLSSTVLPSIRLRTSIMSSLILSMLTSSRGFTPPNTCTTAASTSCRIFRHPLCSSHQLNVRYFRFVSKSVAANVLSLRELGSSKSLFSSAMVGEDGDCAEAIRDEMYVRRPRRLSCIRVRRLRRERV